MTYTTDDIKATLVVGRATQLTHGHDWDIADMADIAQRLMAEAWNEAADAVSEWMANNPSPAGIPSDPPRNPYERES